MEFASSHDDGLIVRMCVEGRKEGRMDRTTYHTKTTSLGNERKGKERKGNETKRNDWSVEALTTL